MAEFTRRQRRKVISLYIDEINYQAALSRVIEFAKEKIPRYVCFANVHMVIEAHKNKSFADQVNHADLVLADGVPLIKTIYSFYGQRQDRIAGMDILPDLIHLGEKNHLRILFFGTTLELLKRIEEKIYREHPNSKLVGLLSPPFNKSLDDESYIHEINESGANLVFVALGCPKQEKWMAKHSHKINAVLLGVGGAFPVYAGLMKRAPLIMQNLGLEWLYRLFQEPSRLFKRYLTTNSLFIYLVIMAKMKEFFKKF